MKICLKTYAPAAGDLLGFAGDWRSLDSLAIKLGTLSSLTHVAGVAFVESRHLRAAARARIERNGGHGDRSSLRLAEAALGWRPRPLLLESTTLCRWPCEIHRHPINGVQAHEPYARVKTYAGRVWLYRPTSDWPIDPEKSERLSKFVLPHLGDHYDLAGAIGSASRILKNRWWYRPANLHALFCSALWDAALQAINFLGPEDYSVVNPAVLLRTLVKIGRYECLGEFAK